MNLRLLLAIVTLLIASPALADEAAKPQGEADDVVETIEVKRADHKGPKHKSLQFLKDNRSFLRSQLDRLSTQVTREHSGAADMLDARFLMLKEMSAAIAAARDTVRSEHDSTYAQGMLSSVTELAGLEAELSLMEKLLAEQRARLLMLEQDFLGHQETALVIVLKGVSGRDAPSSIIITEEGDVLTVPLTPTQQQSLQQGGIAQIYHEFIEPREHTISVTFVGGPWATTPPVPIALETARDRITFLELDLSRLDAASDLAGLLTSVWYR